MYAAAAAADAKMYRYSITSEKFQVVSSHFEIFERNISVGYGHITVHHNPLSRVHLDSVIEIIKHSNAWKTKF